MNEKDDAMMKKTTNEQVIPLKTRLKEVMYAFVLPLVISYLFFKVLFGVSVVTGSSMVPTLYNGQIMFTQKIGYTMPERGDIVIANATEYPFLPEYAQFRTLLVKRVIGLPGDVIQFDEVNQVIYLNGEPLIEDYIPEGTLVDGVDRGTEPFTIPEGHVFLMGDNREHSKDSRSDCFWNIPIEDIEAKCIFVFGTGDRGGK